MQISNLKEYLLNHRIIDEITRCWLWTERKSNNGYGVISLPREDGKRDKDYLVHRLSYIEFIGPLNNLCLHKQLCPNKHCFNPEHLYDGLYADNMQDELDKGLHKNKYGKTNKTHCQNGHELSGDNLIITSELHRRCRTCRDKYNENNPNRKKYNENRKNKPRYLFGKLIE